VDAARKEWQGAITEASSAKPKAKGNGPDLADYMKGLKGTQFDDLLAGAKDTTRGTFNAMALRGLAAGGPMDKVAENTKNTAKNTAKLLEKDFGDNMAFA
jgi:hypothetical protein